MEADGGYPFPLDSLKRSTRNRNLAWSLVFEADRNSEREAALEFLLTRIGGGPCVHRLPLFGSHLGADGNRLRPKGVGRSKVSDEAVE